jgi:CheY-like chemotaxis protein
MIALTAYVMHEHRRQIRAAGADGIIAKPIMSVERLGEEILGFMAEAARTRGGGAAGAQQGQPAPAVEAPSASPSPARPGPAMPSGEGVVDDRVIDELADTVGAAALRGVLERAIEDIASAGADLEEALALDDATRARRASHVISGLAGVVGAERLGALARAVHGASPPSDAGVRPQDAARLVDATLRALEARSRATLAS